MPEWSNGADCKSVGESLRGFESLSAHFLFSRHTPRLHTRRRVSVHLSYAGRARRVRERKASGALGIPPHGQKHDPRSRTRAERATSLFTFVAFLVHNVEASPRPAKSDGDWLGRSTCSRAVEFRVSTRHIELGAWIWVLRSRVWTPRRDSHTCGPHAPDTCAEARRWP